MKERILEACIIAIVVILIYLVTISASFSSFIETFIYLALMTVVPITLGILLWLILSDKIVTHLQLTNKIKYVVYLVLNSVVPLIILLMQSYIDWGNRLTNEVLWANYIGDYFSKFGFIIIGVLPTLIKLSLDLYRKGNLTSKII
jgi:hypothetical protein